MTELYANCSLHIQESGRRDRSQWPPSWGVSARSVFPCTCVPLSACDRRPPVGICIEVLVAVYVVSGAPFVAICCRVRHLFRIMCPFCCQLLTYFLFVAVRCHVFSPCRIHKCGKSRCIHEYGDNREAMSNQVFGTRRMNLAPNSWY